MKTNYTLVILAWVMFPVEHFLANATEESGGKGLRVIVTINTNLASQPVYLDAYQYGQFVAGYDSYIDTGSSETELAFENGEIDNGEFEICATVIDVIQQCAYGYSGEEKEPEYMTIDMYSNNTPQPVQGNQQQQAQSQSQSSNNENNNKQETTIYICKENGCTAQ